MNIYEWNNELASKVGATCPREWRMENFWDDLFATGFTNHYLGDANAAVWYFPALMYSMMRCLHSKNVLEIGIFQGYTAYYLARAAFKGGGQYYGIEIDEKFCSLVSRNLIEKDLPHKIFNANSKDLTAEDFKNWFTTIDFAFIDGEHNDEAVIHEVDLIYPHLPTETGIICIHDCWNQCVDGAVATLQEDKRFEVLTIPLHNGLAILRKIEGAITARERGDKLGLKKLGCQRGETPEQMEERHKQGDFFTDYVNSPSHDEQMRKEHPEMANFPEFDRLKEREKRYGG